MSPHPIIAMWSHPRSMSTAIERIMRERGDLDCLHEPFMYDYCAPPGSPDAAFRRAEGPSDQLRSQYAT
ncbi:MAG: hypothetical protein M9957_01250 [Rhodobacteraceae bacterium]|nr:hypothetical protein [Paracoccaceae bacterium]